MTLRTGHGRGKGSPRIEVMPPDELPSPLPATSPAPTGPVMRRSNGTIADSATAKELGKRGGAARARRVRLVDSLGLSAIAGETTFGPYRGAAEEFVKFHLSQLAAQAGGQVGAAPSSIVASAALQLAASRWAFDRAAESSDPALFKLGSALANDSRQNLLAAYELAVREAKARGEGRSAPAPWLEEPEDASGDAETTDTETTAPAEAPPEEAATDEAPAD